ncbi:hypothetical protein FQR65_LT18872 [Abscondita terminalis]|nr:hypothetical protein FQR65_LT18872 [Abscondita terminalis]
MLSESMRQVVAVLKMSLLSVEMFDKQILQNLPFLISGWHVCCCILTYIIAVKKKHVYYMFPYISDTAAMSPETNIFAQCLNIGAGMMAVGLYIRYKQIDYDIKTKNITLNPLWNKISIILGFMACLGVSVVGNFPELSVLSVHVLGAFMAFGIGILYFSFQVFLMFYFSYLTRFVKGLFYVRLFLVGSLMLLLISVFVFGSLSFQKFDGKSHLWWTEDHGGYGFRLVSVFSEWLMYIFVFVYIATFRGEFGSIESGAIVLKFKQES